MSKEPKGIKGTKAKLRRQRQLTSAEVRRALLEASKAIDQQSREIDAYKKIVTGERAQVIYYQEKYVAMVKRECLDAVPVGWLNLDEKQQLEFTKKAIIELYSDATIAPHDGDADKHKLRVATWERRSFCNDAYIESPT